MSNYYTPQFRFGPTLTSTVKSLIIVNVIVFVIQFLFMLFQSTFLIEFLAFYPIKVRNFYLHQFFTYAFLHVDFFHILFNMLTLW
ncbi:MAG: rhomboid family intramembrane serine protease, partial [Leptospiraceae bacterium]|nr:rhomboid family intramembrane serine protease [Leptospiraceae bacterium]